MISQYGQMEAPTGAETYSSAMADARNYMAWIVSAFAVCRGAGGCHALR
jgi:hypothetical protein